jgi:hypothetical protein
MWWRLLFSFRLDAASTSQDADFLAADFGAEHVVLIRMICPKPDAADLRSCLSWSEIIRTNGSAILSMTARKSTRSFSRDRLSSGSPIPFLFGRRKNAVPPAFSGSLTTPCMMSLRR